MGRMTAPSKEDLLRDLRWGRDALIAAVRALDPSTLEQGCYENGWNGRQILAHIAAIEWTYPRLIEVARAAQSGREGPPAEPAESPARGGMDAYNARQVEKRAGATVEELLAEFAGNREAFIAAVEGIEDDLFQAPVRSAGGRTGSLGQVLYEVSVGHAGQHLADLLGTAAEGA